LVWRANGGWIKGAQRAAVASTRRNSLGETSNKIVSACANGRVGFAY
jgi:hypothetical protein